MIVFGLVVSWDGVGGRIPRLICTQFLIDQNCDGHEFEVQTRVDFTEH